MNNDCFCKKDCDPCHKPKCGCAEPVFSVEAMPDDPTTLRFNVNGKSVWYDFSPVVRAGETSTALSVDAVARTLNYLGEKTNNTISARELGAILHVADLGDVDANSIKDYGILNYRVESDCGEGCEGLSNGWRADNPIDLGAEELEYVLGSDADGKMASLMPPTDTTKFNYVAWAGAGKVKYVTPTVVATVPDDGTYKYPLYLDPATGEIVAVRTEVQG